jgi:two-component system, chemotaxis family, protein-glutamate methylesterase/glutaminase
MTISGSTNLPRPEAVVVGGSAGGIEALGTLLAELPAAFTPPIVVVVHLPRRRPSSLAEALAFRSGRRVVEVEDKQPIEPGAVYAAPPDYHLLVDVGPSLALAVDVAVNFSIPSIDVLFESAADVYGARVAGVVLSGANEDGARGLAAIARAGGAAFVQRPDEAGVSLMPEAAIAACPTAVVAPVRGIASALAALVVRAAERGAAS